MTDSTKCSYLRLCLYMASVRCGYYIADVACRFLRYQASVRNVRWVTFLERIYRYDADVAYVLV